ncbi:MAG: hypothetical protein KA154_15070 [Gemmatimonadaceae bacterium]|jgi:hypothetical protein|nr:hypothetical protein [Gemmatimonadaceae bacterium]MCC6432383.1 hypothetical protein [Gemmatimonadaceae bacterium]
MSRVLTIVERHVPDAGRAAYLTGVESRRQQAAANHAHFWVFEHDDEPGRFVEFTEGGAASDIAAVHDGVLPAPLWRAVQGD